MRKLAISSAVLLSLATFGAHANNNSLKFTYESWFHPDNARSEYENTWSGKMEYSHAFRSDLLDGFKAGFENYFEKTNDKQFLNFILKTNYDMKSDSIKGLVHGPLVEYQFRKRGRSPSESSADDYLQENEKLRLGYSVSYRFNKEFRLRGRFRYERNLEHSKTDYSAGYADKTNYAYKGSAAEYNLYAYYKPDYLGGVQLYAKGTIYKCLTAESATSYKDCTYSETAKSWKPALEFGFDYEWIDDHQIQILYKARPYDNSLDSPVGNKDSFTIGYRIAY